MKTASRTTRNGVKTSTLKPSKPSRLGVEFQDNPDGSGDFILTGQARELVLSMMAKTGKTASECLDIVFAKYCGLTVEKMNTIAASMKEGA